MSQIPAEILEQQIMEMCPSTSASKQRLCSRCQNLKVWGQVFRIMENISDLEERSHFCDFCLLRWKACKDLGIDIHPRVVFERSGSHITVNNMYPPILSIFQKPGMWTLTQSLSNLEFVEHDTHKCLKNQPSAV